jgi:hypothetical protein
MAQHAVGSEAQPFTQPDCPAPAVLFYHVTFRHREAWGEGRASTASPSWDLAQLQQDLSEVAS